MCNFLYCAVIVLAVITDSALAQVLYPTDAGEHDCVTPSQKRGQCVNLYECSYIFNMLTQKPLQEEVRRFLTESQCGFHGDSPLVCCQLNSPRSTPGTTVAPAQPPVVQNPSSSSGDGGELPTPGICGGGTSDRIYGGNQTAIDEYTFMALLQYFKPAGKKGFHCGGVLINSRYVLTAAHCIVGKGIPADWTLSSVRLGEWDTSTDRDCDYDDCSDPPIDVPVEERITHADYNPNSKSQLHDIALLRLARPVQYTSWIKPICIRQEVTLRNTNFVGMKMDVAGWGKTESASSSNIKLKATVEGVSIAECNKVYSRHGVSLQESQLCAGGQRGIDSCRGDSGGPLIALDRTSRLPYYFLAGIVSFGPVPCGLEGWPGVYTKVSRYTDWIQSYLRP